MLRGLRHCLRTKCRAKTQVLSLLVYQPYVFKIYEHIVIHNLTLAVRLTYKKAWSLLNAAFFYFIRNPNKQREKELWSGWGGGGGAGGFQVTSVRRCRVPGEGH